MNAEKQALPNEVEVLLRGIEGNCKHLLSLARSRSEDFLIADVQKILDEAHVFHEVLVTSLPRLADTRDPEIIREIRHDLTNPLNPIIGYSEMLIEESEDLESNPYTSDLIDIRTSGRALLRWVGEGLFASQSSEPVTEDPAVQVYAEREPRGLGASRVLIVEDNPDNQELLSRLLSNLGCEVDCEGSGEEALERLPEEDYDLVFLDIGLPGIDGFEVLEKIRATQSPMDLPVIMATALDATEDVVRAFELGANDYVTKPFNKAVVLARAKTQISLKKSQEEIRNLIEGLELRNVLIRETFGRYVPDEVVEELLSQPEALALEGQRKKVSILMSDLRGFTSMSERLPPEQIVRILNTYLGTMVGVIDEFHGTIDEFIGDAILVIFGAPHTREDDTERAVACALAMQEAMTSVNHQLESQGLPAVQMGIGINTGEVVAGNIGSLERAKYGVIGMPVNLASRIESYSVGGQVLVSENTYREIAELLEVREETSIRVKGFEEPIRFYEVCGMRGRFRFSRGRKKCSLSPLSPPIAVSFSTLDGKAMQEEKRHGTIREASLREAILDTETNLPRFTNLEIDLMDRNGNKVSGNLYAKVLSVPEQPGAGYGICFTDVPEPVKKLLEESIVRGDSRKECNEG